MRLNSESEDRFPWHYFNHPTEAAAEAVVRWIYTGFAGRAYQGFLEQGRGLLVGPFLTDENQGLISTDEFVERRGQQRAIGMTVVYVAADSESFRTTLPDAALREQLSTAVERYDPTRECVILLLANNVPLIARIVGTTARIALVGASRPDKESEMLQ